MNGINNSIKPQDLKVNDVYLISNEDGGLDEMRLLSPPRTKDYIIELPSFDVIKNKEVLVMININFPREIYIKKRMG